MKMEIFDEMRKIAGYNQAIKNQIEKLQDKLDTEGLWFEGATLISGCSVRKEDNGYHLYQNGELLSRGYQDEYFCNQSVGYCEDDYYGTLWFRTRVPGQWVQVAFNM